MSTDTLEAKPTRLSLLAAPALAPLTLGLMGAYSFAASGITGGPACPVLALTDVPCPGCGLTRSLLALFEGDLAGALAWNAVGLLVILAAGLVWAQWTARRVWRREALELPRPSRTFAWTFMLIVLAWGLVRLMPFWPGPAL